MASILASILGGYAIDKIGSAVGLANGGKIPETGIYKLHKGEMVLPANVVSKVAPKPNAKTMRDAVSQANSARRVSLKEKARVKRELKKVENKAKKEATKIAVKLEKATQKANAVAVKKATKAVGKKPRTAKQLANDKRLGALAKSKSTTTPPPAPARTKRGTGTYVKSGKYKGVNAKNKAKKDAKNK